MITSIVYIFEIIFIQNYNFYSYTIYIYNYVFNHRLFKKKKNKENILHSKVFYLNFNENSFVYRAQCNTGSIIKHKGNSLGERRYGAHSIRSIKEYMYVFL